MMSISTRKALFISTLVSLGVLLPLLALGIGLRMACTALSTVPPDSPANDPGTEVGKEIPVKISVSQIGPGMPPVQLISPWPTNPGPIAKIEAIAESPSGNYLAWGDSEQNVFVWALGSNSCDLVNDGGFGKSSAHDAYRVAGVRAIRFKDEKTLYWIDVMGIVWKAEKTGEHTWLRKQINQTGLGSSNALLDGAFISSPARRDKLITAERVIEKYDLDSVSLVGTSRIYPMKRGLYHEVHEMAVSIDEKRLAILSQCHAGIVDLDAMELSKAFDVEHGESIAISPDASRIAVGTYDDGIVIYDVQSGALLRKFRVGIGDTPNPLAFGNEAFLWFGINFDVYRIDLSKGRISIELKGIYASSMVLSKDKEKLFIGSDVGTVFIHKPVVPTENSIRGRK